MDKTSLNEDSAALLVFPLVCTAFNLSFKLIEPGHGHVGSYAL